MDETTAQEVLVAATGQPDVDHAVAWLAEGRDIKHGSTWQWVLTALAVQPQHSVLEAALRSVVSHSARSHLDSSADLLDLERVVTAEMHEMALATLTVHTVGHSLASLSPESIFAAQSDNAGVMTTLCEVAGLSYRDLGDRIRSAGGATPPGEPGGSWSMAQVKAAWEILNRHVAGTLTSAVAGATPARALEHLQGVPGRTETGWALVARMHAHGVPYGTLLAQRGAGSAWLAHRNRTNGLLVGIVTDQIETTCASAGLEVLTQRGLGSNLWTTLLGHGAGPLQLTIVRRSLEGEPEPVLAVTVANARDGGTVRKSVGQLAPLAAAVPQVPLAAVVVGPGWVERAGATAELARAFEGRVYTELQLDDLAALAASLI